MSVYNASISWDASGPEFLKGNYSRAHRWKFDGGASVEASASPEIVPLPWSVPANVDPEEAFVASISSCHMLFFLSLAARDGFDIERYDDDAEGYLEKDTEGKLRMTRVILHPRVKFTKPVEMSVLEELHQESHERCFIANSVNTDIEVKVTERS